MSVVDSDRTNVANMIEHSARDMDLYASLPRNTLICEGLCPITGVARRTIWDPIVNNTAAMETEEVPVSRALYAEHEEQYQSAVAGDRGGYRLERQQLR